MSAWLAVAPDGNTRTCTTESGAVVEGAPDPGNGIPGLGSLLNSAGNALSGSECTFDDRYQIPGMIKSSADLIASTPSPTIADGAEQAVGVTGFLQGSTTFYAMVLFVISIAIRAAIIGWRQRWQDMEGLLQLMLGMLVIVGIGAGLVQAVLVMTDAYAPWVINLAGNGDYLTNMSNLLADIPDPSLGDVPGYLLVGVAWIAAGLQWLALAIVSVLLPVAVGLWPLFASVEGISSGAPWRTPITKYILAMASYKFVIANVYAAVFAGIGDTAAGGNAGKGVLLLLLASLMMPMLVKIFAPWGATPGTGASGASVIVAGAALKVAR